MGVLILLLLLARHAASQGGLRRAAASAQTDCKDPQAVSCIADYPGFWRRAYLKCSDTYLYTWSCKGWFCGWCSWKWNDKTMCSGTRSMFCNGGGSQQCRP